MQPPAQLPPDKPRANAALGTAALEGLADPAGQRLSFSLPLSLDCRSAQLAGFSSWMSTHVGVKQTSTLPSVHCKGKEGRRQCWEGHDDMPWPFHGCVSACRMRHVHQDACRVIPQPGQGVTPGRGPRGSCRAGDQEVPMEQAACPTLNSAAAQCGQGM